MSEQDLQTIVDQAGDELKNKWEQAKVAAKSQVSKRSSAKRMVTILVNKLKSDKDAHSTFVQETVEKVKEKLAHIELLDEGITEAYSELGVFDDMAELHEKFVECQVDYHYAAQTDLNSILQARGSKESAVSSDIGSTLEGSTVTADQIHQLINMTSFKAKVHEVKIPTFYGTQEDVLLFGDFLRQFKDLIGDRTEYTAATKLVYLKAYLRGGALDLIKHLSNEDSNYEIALEFLQKEFLDHELVVDQHLSRLVSLKAPSEKDVDGMRQFFNTARTSIYELKNLGLDAMADDTMGNKLLSYLLCEKLPTSFKAKLSQTINTDYPTINQLIHNYNDVLKSLQKTITKPTASYKPNESYKVQSNAASNRPRPNGKVTGRQSKDLRPTYNPHTNFKPASLQAFQTQATGHREVKRVEETRSKRPNGKFAPFRFTQCKLCTGEHSMLRCTVYQSPSEKTNRFKQLGLCSLCSSADHMAESCKPHMGTLKYPCKFCNSFEHIAAVCYSLNRVAETQNKLCTFSNGRENSTTILPSISTVMSASAES